MAKVKKSQYGSSVSQDKSGKYNVVTKANTKEGPRYYQATHPNENTARMLNNARARANSADSTRAKDINPIDIKNLANQKHGGKTKAKAKDGKWIQKAIKKPGALRSQLGAKPGKPIPAAKLAKAAKAKGKLGQRARLAMTLKKMKK
jgi:hypothetical protein